MRRQWILPGIVALLIAAGLYAGASAVAGILPALVQGLAAVVVFLFLLGISLAEIPVMLFGLRRMAHSATTPGWMLIATYFIYVTFGAVYASVFALLTTQVVWGLVLVALCLARFVSGMWIYERA